MLTDTDTETRSNRTNADYEDSTYIQYWICAIKRQIESYVRPTRHKITVWHLDTAVNDVDTILFTNSFVTIFIQGDNDQHFKRKT